MLHSSDIDDDELGSEVDDEIDSDIEEAKKNTKKEAKKRKAEAAEDDDDDGDGDGDDARKSKKSKTKEIPAKQGGKKKKDPSAPKNAMSAYLLYSIATRAKVKEDNPDASFGDLARLISANFKALSDEERAKWDRKAAADKERYTEEMSNYDAPPADDDDDDNDDAPSTKKAKKDPNAPKKAKSGYLYFMSEARTKLKEENPDATFGDLTRMVASAYKALDAKDKERYEAMARADKKRYTGEMDGYSPKKGSKEDAMAKNKKGAKGKEKKEKDPNAPKGATTSFFYFMKDARATAKAKNPDMKASEMSKLLGEKFKNLSEQEKAKYESKAKKDKERYLSEMAAYTKKKSSKAAEVAPESDDDDDDDEDLVVDDVDDDDDDDSD